MAILALVLALPASARAENYDGLATLILSMLLVPVTAIALLLLALSLVRQLPGLAYVLVTMVFLPVAGYGVAYFAGISPLAPDDPGPVYYTALAVLAVCFISYFVITLRFWRRFITVGRDPG
jgi:hypothetical protein